MDILMMCTLTCLNVLLLSLVNIAYSKITEECLEFEVQEGHSLYGYNNHIVPEVYIEDCRALCIAQRTFVCTSFDYNSETGNCYMSSEDQFSQPDSFGTNPNTDYYQRICIDITNDETVAVPTTITSLPDVATHLSLQTTTRTTVSQVEENETVYRGNTDHARFFQGDSYIRADNFYRGTEMSVITMDFTLIKSDGLLVYFTDELDFMSLTLRNGYLEFRYDLGSGPAILRSTMPLALNSSHRVEASRLNTLGKLQVDDFEVVTGESEGNLRKLNVDPDFFIGMVPVELIESRTIDKRVSLLKSNNEHNQTNSMCNPIYYCFLYITSLLNRTDVDIGFYGCIHSLQIEGLGSNIKYNLSFNSEDVIEAVNVGSCSNDLPFKECSLVCNYGECKSSGLVQRCVCHEKYVGVDCNTFLVIDVLDQVKASENNHHILNCIGRSNIDSEKLKFSWLHNGSLIPKDSKLINSDADYIHSEYTTNVLGGETLFVAQLFLHHELSGLTGNYTCKVMTSAGEKVEKILTVDKEIKRLKDYI